MRDGDLDQIVDIERRSFRSPWRREHFLHELHGNPLALSRVAERQGRIVAYACMWCVDDELAVNDFAVRAGERRRGVGSWFLGVLLEEARGRGCRSATLEVRPSNRAARQLYARHGFVEIGRRRNYYALEGEDAIVMTARLDADPRIAAESPEGL